MNLRELFEGLNNSLPNENNLGNPIADSDSKLKNFWNWFNGSKIVDDNGRPIVVHHGTPSGGFDAFDIEKTGDNTLMTKQGPGFYFTDEKNARQYMKAVNKSKGQTAQLYSVYLNIKNPLFITGKSTSIDLTAIYNVYLHGDNEWFFSNWIPFDTKISKEASKEDKAATYVKSLATGWEQDIKLLQNIVRAYKNKALMFDNMIRFLNADGVEFTDHHGKIHVAWNPNQVKQIINRGTYGAGDSSMDEGV